MKISESFDAFAGEESGAVTLDWVVITAALAGLAISVLAILSGGAARDAAAIPNGTVEITRNAATK